MMCLVSGSINLYHPSHIVSDIVPDATLTKKLDDIIAELRVPNVLAHAFADMCETGQAAFFVEVARIMRSWDTSSGLYIQSSRIGERLKMNDDVREVLMTILASAEEK